MTCLDLEPDLGDYVDGTLDHRDIPRLDAHLRRCSSCRAVVEDLRAMRIATRSLDALTPPSHLFPRIAAAVEAERRRSPIRRLLSRGSLARLFSEGGLVHRRGSPEGEPPANAVWSGRIAARLGARGPVHRSLGEGGWQPAFAATVLVALLGGGVWASWHSVAEGTRASIPAPRTSDVVAAIDPGDDQMQAAEQHYTRVIASLEQIARTERTTLDTPVAAVLDENLAVLDHAIGESREALKTEPTSELAQESLFEALRSKIALLQETIALINEMRKGNQDGAARIVSGMNQ